MKKPLLSEKGLRKQKIGVFLPSIIILFFAVLVHSIESYFGDENTIVLIIIFGSVFSMALIAGISAYLSLPVEVVEMSGEGFIFKNVINRRHVVHWNDIVEIDRKWVKKYGDYFIGVRGKISVKWIEIRADVGEEIRRAWERWKEEQEVKR